MEVAVEQHAEGWGEFLGRRMLACGLPTNRDLARAAGVPESVISRWRTRAVRPSTEQLRRLVGPLRLSVLELFVAAGYLTPEEARVSPSAPLAPVRLTVLQALEEDPDLPPDLRSLLAEQYRGLAAHARRCR